MFKHDDVDNVRKETLKGIERYERHAKNTFRAAAAIEALFVGGYLLLMDYSNKTHWLIFIGSVAVYWLVSLGLFIVGINERRSTLRVLKAIELLEKHLGKEQP